MKLRWTLLLLGGSLFLLILAGCNLPDKPTCPTSGLQAVTLGGPAMWAVVDSLSPTLSWSYPDTTCNPEGYRIDLKTGPLFTDDLSGGTGNPSTTWSPGSNLQPGREYSWAVRPINGTTLGPIAGNRYFFTGPMCATEDLRSPALLEPDDGSEVHELSPSLKWQYLDSCLPEGYRIDLSVDPTFTDTSLSGGTGNPSTRWGPGHPLADCTTYFWRTAPINDTTLGPSSDVFTFRTNVTGACAPEPTGTVGGLMWYDQCSVAMDVSPVPNPLPAGCVQDVYGVDADGIYQQEEPFMSNITVNLGPGDCPVGGPTSTLSSAKGVYLFSQVPPGKYCINVNAASFGGPAATGHWTVMPSGHEGNTYRSVLVGAGQTVAGQDFAWYQNGGSGPTPTKLSTFTPTKVFTFTPTKVSTFTPTKVFTFTPTHVGLLFTPKMNVNCRQGPDLQFGIVDVAMKGTPYVLDGQNAAKTWYRLMFTEVKGCWVMADTGTVDGDISGLRILRSPALPTFTPTEVPTFTPTEIQSVSCGRYLDEKSCELQTACLWVPAVTHAGDCVNK